MLTAQKRRSQAEKTLRETFHVFPSELGWMAISWNEKESLTRLSFAHPSAGAAAAIMQGAEHSDQLPPTIRDLVARLQRFAVTGDDDFRSVTLGLDHLTDFQRKVVQACRKIRPGQTRSYGELATLAGYPGAARAVGNVMRSNRFPLIIPCHRVIGSDGKLCGFTSPQGLDMKRRLLEREKEAAG